jgi:membrane fusion protein, multidrug efflux system
VAQYTNLTILRPASLAAVLATVAVCVGCADNKVKGAAPVPAAPVLAATAERRDVPHQLRAIGAVESFSNVAVRTQVTGELTGVFFKEGDDVKKGQLIFTLDKRQAEAAIRRAEGNLAHDQAQLENARAQARRYEGLFKEGVVSKEQNDTQQTSMQALEAAVQSDRAMLEDAKVQLTYCSIYSPINGRTGYLQVHRGNMVKANDNPPLVTINQIQPIYTTFTVPEQFLSEIRGRNAHGQLRVQAQPPNDPGKPVVGTLSFIDNTVDQATGTIKLKAQYTNADRRLWPGQFVDVILVLGTRANAVVVPNEAVQNGQQGQYLFVIKPDMTADLRKIQVGESVGGVTVVEKGVEAGERVVTDGQLRLAPGSPVEIKPSISPAQPPAQGN